MIFVKDIKEGYSDIYLSQTSAQVNSNLVIISGPSGIGRSSVLDRLVSKYKYDYLKNYTTRDSRKISTEKYIEFVPPFEIGAKHDEIFACTKWDVNQQIYYLPSSEITKLQSTSTFMYETTYFGNVVKKLNPEKVFNIWLYSSNPESIRNNLGKRNTEKGEETLKRLEHAIATQNFILQNRENFIKEHKIDYFLDVYKKDIKSICSEILGVLGSILKY